MKSELTTDYYWKTELHDRESEKVFSYVWIFAGLVGELAEDNSYFLRKWGKYEVIFRKNKSDIVALRNSCPHRLNSIFTEESGVGPLVCKYHAWSFHGDGKLRKIPFEREIYKFSEREMNGLCLKKFETRVVGQFIFVNLAEKPIPFSKQFSPKIVSDLELISKSFDHEFGRRVQRLNFNWKLAYENLRDPNHVPFVHSKTIATWTDFGVPQIPVKLGGNAVTLRTLSYGGPDADIPNMAHESWHEEVEPWTSEKKYYNWLLYPNLHIVSATCGHSFSIEYHHPVSSVETDVVVYMIPAKRKSHVFNASQVIEDHYKGAKLILDEDFAILESTQRQLNGKSGEAPTIGAYEWLNVRTESWYLNRMHTSRMFNPKRLLSAPVTVVLALVDYVRKHGMRRLLARIRDEFSVS